MLKSAFLSLIATVAVGFAFGTDLKPGQQYFKGDPNVIVPASGVQKKGFKRTHYLIYAGPKTGQALQPLYAGSIGFQTSIPGYKPSDILAAYSMPANGGSGAIAIVDAFDLPTSLADFNFFSTQFGLPTETSSNPTASTNKVFQVVYATGTKPQADKGWGGEIALDIEWAHAIAPKAKIYLVEAASNSDADLYYAETVAASLVGVKQVSNSWGGAETSSDLANNVYFPDNNGVVYFVSSGDNGGVQQYPAESPYVVAVGGTSLTVSGGKFLAETAWSDAGGGPSSYQPRLSYQNVVQSIVGNFRGCPDVAAVADPYTGCAVYSSYALGGWEQVGGTSLACPVMAAITNVRGQFSKGTLTELARIYKNYGSKYYRDIVSGQAGSFPAKVGYDFVTGIGTAVGLYASNINYNYTVTADPLVYIGSKVSGNAASLTAVDNNWYVLQTAPASGLGQTAGLSADFAIGNPLSYYSSLTLNLTCKSTDFATVQVFAWDQVNQVYKLIKASPGSSASSTITIDLTSYPNMVSSSGAVRVYLRAFQPLRFGSGAFQFGLNQLTISGGVSG